MTDIHLAKSPSRQITHSLNLPRLCLRVACLFPLALAPIAFAAIFQCKDPATGKMNFTDKPCPPSQEGGIMGRDDKPSPYENHSAGSLQAHLVKREKELGEAYTLLGFTNKGEDFNRFHKTSQIERKAWQENRDSLCYQRFLESGKANETRKDKELLICKIQMTEEKLASYKKLTSSGDLREIATENVRVTIPPGKQGLQTAVQQGLISPATDAEITRWQEKAGIRSTPSILRYSQKYVIRKMVTFSGNLGGANAAIFLIPDSTLMPSGDYGHSALLFMDSGACTGIMCSTLSQ